MHKSRRGLPMPRTRGRGPESCSHPVKGLGALLLLAHVTHHVRGGAAAPARASTAHPTAARHGARSSSGVGRARPADASHAGRTASVDRATRSPVPRCRCPHRPQKTRADPAAELLITFLNQVYRGSQPRRPDRSEAIEDGIHNLGGHRGSGSPRFRSRFCTDPQPGRSRHCKSSTPGRTNKIGRFRIHSKSRKGVVAADACQNGQARSFLAMPWAGPAVATVPMPVTGSFPEKQMSKRSLDSPQFCVSHAWQAAKLNTPPVPVAPPPAPPPPPATPATDRHIRRAAVDVSAGATAARCFPGVPPAPVVPPVLASPVAVTPSRGVPRRGCASPVRGAGVAGVARAYARERPARVPLGVDGPSQPARKQRARSHSKWVENHGESAMWMPRLWTAARQESCRVGQRETPGKAAENPTPPSRPSFDSRSHVSDFRWQHI